MEQENSSVITMRRRRHRLLLTVVIVIVFLVSIPIAWIGTLTAIDVARLKSGERIDVNALRGRSSLASGAAVSVSEAELKKLDDAGNAPELGNRNARITIVAFLDYQCPYSAEFASVVRRVMQDEKSNVHFILHDDPVIDAAYSRLTANAADCMLEQGQTPFWRFFDEMFADQSKRSSDDFRTAAKVSGGDVSKFDACFAARKHDLEIDGDIALAKGVGVGGTPTIFVNHARIQGAMSEKDFRTIIERAKTALPR